MKEILEKINQILKDWELNESITDSRVMEDVIQAMHEAYCYGGCDSVMNSTIREHCFEGFNLN